MIEARAEATVDVSAEVIKEITRGITQGITHHEKSVPSVARDFRGAHRDHGPRLPRGDDRRRSGGV
ncbi:hypothetical protein BN2475_270154 [Paraburkholderia ribeironis]|uniref:Uncharacterized protein n=1 Tax=Paraburkholderia ribeironis TaxID=1247936 RepID=A0A1N7S0I8_9BURK|nr:hypothetical protein BN2475_270154 [Paraburkholderia ribeironis]